MKKMCKNLDNPKKSRNVTFSLSLRLPFRFCVFFSHKIFHVMFCEHENVEIKDKTCRETFFLKKTQNNVTFEIF